MILCPLTPQPLSLNEQATVATASLTPTSNNWQDTAGLTPGLVDVGTGSAPTGANSNAYDLVDRQSSAPIGSQVSLTLYFPSMKFLPYPTMDVFTSSVADFVLGDSEDTVPRYSRDLISGETSSFPLA